MRFEYLLYPNAVEKIESSGIRDRVDKLDKSEDGLPYIGGCRYKDGVINSVKDLKQRGFYKHFPKEFAQKYQSTLNKILRNPQGSYWLIRKPSGTFNEKCALEDMDLFTGDTASMILTPEELWDYSKFNFSSPSELATTVGAYITQRSKECPSDYRNGYQWISKRVDGSEVKNQITGSEHYDLRIYQTDITPYPTTDPFDNEIEMRPVLDSDNNFIDPYHSTEGSLLVAVMKYVEQTGIKTQYQEDKAKSLIKWGHSLGQGGGGCTEHLGGFDHDPRQFFWGYEYSIPVLDNSDETEKHTPFSLGIDGEAEYGVYIAHNGDFILSYENYGKSEKPHKTINIRFRPEDAEHLIKGLIFQSAKGLGRTSANQLFEILKYRYSSKFEKDQKN
ncbi:MAG: hypothetical protein PHE32_03160 [Candidatus Shapirobacteria bacterium]|nr:hypothetical protein [Candidatus Shapirobacteria bacterium]MDD4410672.1 hypothetical protein [Candidatus Shapirobacteria bacterium]